MTGPLCSLRWWRLWDTNCGIKLDFPEKSWLLPPCLRFMRHRLSWINTLKPRPNGCHFADDTFKCIFLNEIFWIPITIWLEFVPKGPINNISALVQIMAWRRPGDKPLSESMMVSLPTHICVTRPQWVNPLYVRDGVTILNMWISRNHPKLTHCMLRWVYDKICKFEIRHGGLRHEEFLVICRQAPALVEMIQMTCWWQTTSHHSNQCWPSSYRVAKAPPKCLSNIIN